MKRWIEDGFYFLVLKTSECSAENKVISSRSRVISSIFAPSQAQKKVQNPFYDTFIEKHRQ